MAIYRSLPPCGGSGLKYVAALALKSLAESPSMRREWIEIILTKIMNPESGVSLHAEGVD